MVKEVMAMMKDPVAWEHFKVVVAWKCFKEAMATMEEATMEEAKMKEAVATVEKAMAMMKEAKMKEEMATMKEAMVKWKFLDVMAKVKEAKVKEAKVKEAKEAMAKLKEAMAKRSEQDELMAKRKREDHERVRPTFSMENLGFGCIGRDGSGNFILILPQSESGFGNLPPHLATFIGNSSNSTPSQVAPLEACIELGLNGIGDSKSSDDKSPLVHGNAIAANTSPNPNDPPPPVNRWVRRLEQKSEPVDDDVTKLAETTVPVRRPCSYVSDVLPKAFQASLSAILLRLTTGATATRVLAKLAVIACVAGILATIQNDLPPQYLWVAVVAFLVPTAAVVKA